MIEAGKTDRQYWRDLWNYRELFYILSWRDIAVRYKQTIIGIIWAVLKPFLTMVIFVVIFGKIAKLPSESVPYPILVFSAMLPWNFFSMAFSSASNSLISNTNLISKIYFPRIIIPAASIIVSVVDFFISFFILIILMIWYSYFPDIRIISIIFFLILAFFVTLGSSLFISALNVEYRDFKFVVPFIVQLGLYVSPVGFSTSVIPEKYRLFFYLNPMVGVIDGFRWSITKGKIPLNFIEILFSVIITIIMFVLGISYFRKVEKTFADVI